MEIMADITRSPTSRRYWPGLRPWITATIASILLSATVADERDFSRDSFGYNPFPVWTHLTEFELQIINRVNGAQRTDADTLLALYLLASGEVRTEAEFNAHQQTIDEFLRGTSANRPADQERRLGEALLADMHTHFFLSATEDPQASGYELNQSTLTGILNNRIYNCISSALLFSVLAEKSGLRTTGVIMPSHAFVQIELDGGDVIEVETTSPSGFDVIRDENFYTSEASEWFRARQLVVPDYDDYRNRKFVSAIGLGLENLWSQHTTADIMAYPDRMRLAEIKGHLQADDYRAQHNRLIYYYRESDYLRLQNDVSELFRLYAHIESYLSSMETLARGDEALADREFQTVFHLVQATRARALIGNGHIQEGIALARTLLQTLDDTLREAEVIRSDLYLALAAYSEPQIAAGEFVSARAAYDGLEPDCATQTNCITAIDGIYAAWVNSLWQQRDWQGVATLIHDYQKLALESPNRESFNSNLESSYLNMANQSWYDEDRDAAMLYLITCQQRSPATARCTERLLEMRRSL
jgi:hypothetical protein